MVSIATYLTTRFTRRLSLFLNHWYVGGFFVFRDGLGYEFRRIGRFFALRVTLQNFFRPIYQDRTISGHIISFFFRFFRVVLGVIAYFISFILGIILYLAWAGFPLYVIYKIFTPLFS